MSSPKNYINPKCLSWLDKIAKALLHPCIARLNGEIKISYLILSPSIHCILVLGLCSDLIFGQTIVYWGGGGGHSPLLTMD